tara:strand:+ start:82 stop:516 length:435 start_codon:yes stop_codon:yes gene_type:complete
MKLRADQASVIVELIDSLEKIRDMFNNNDPNTNEDVEILTSNNRDYLLSAHNQINKFVEDYQYNRCRGYGDYTKLYRYGMLKKLYAIKGIISDLKRMDDGSRGGSMEFQICGSRIDKFYFLKRYDWGKIKGDIKGLFDDAKKKK